MNNAVIYTRYSTVGQNEQSIEGQLRICKEYAEKQGFNVVKTYIDKARSAWKENTRRPDFDKMIADASSKTFQHIIVYKFDRFVRGRAKSISLKKRLMDDYGVKVFSATEPVSDDEGGEIYEMFLEWNDEKYSQRLSKRVRDGLTTSVENGTFCGGTLIYGYKIRKEPIPGKNDRYIKYVEIDEPQADIVRYVFKEYATGNTKDNIAKELNKRKENNTDKNGKPFTGKSFERMLNNEKYTGEFMFGDRLTNNMFPQIIDKVTFRQVQERLKANHYGKNAPKEPYLLTGKAKCGHCDETDMVSDGGISHTGKVHYYYACKKKKKDKCDKKRENKNTLELLVTVRSKRYLSNPKNAEFIVDGVIRGYEQRTSHNEIKSYETRIAKAHIEVDDLTNTFIMAKNDLLRAKIEQKMNELEIYIKDLQKQKAQLEHEKGLKVTRQDLLTFIAELVKGDENDKAYQKRLIDNLVYKVFVFDKKVRIFFNIKGGSEIDDVTLEQSNIAENQAKIKALQSNPRVQIRTQLAEEEGFEPPCPLRLPVFKTGRV